MAQSGCNVAQFRVQCGSVRVRRGSARVRRESVQGVKWLSGRVRHGSVDDGAWLIKGGAWLSKGGAWLSRVRHG